jgi:hypothetical protein
MAWPGEPEKGEAALASFFLLLRRTKKMPRPARAIAATPPTDPPTIAPIGAPPSSELSVLVDVGVELVLELEPVSLSVAVVASDEASDDVWISIRAPSGVRENSFVSWPE